MQVLVVGASYQTSALALRERLAVSEAQRPAALRELIDGSAIAEVMIISTCNRVEIYAVSPDPQLAQRRLKEWFSGHSGLPLESLDSALYTHTDDAALRHMFRVTASLDAMVVGEAQVTGQMKRAFSAAERVGGVGPLLMRTMQRAFFISKRVRAETAISRHPASLSSVAVDLAARIFEDVADLSVLVIGAGEMAELALARLISNGVRRLRIANRTVAHAEEIARRIGGNGVALDDIDRHLAWADLVITSTASPETIIHQEMLTAVMRTRRSRSLLLVDIAVPRDIDEEVRSLANVYLFDVDDLEHVVSENLKARRRAAKLAERIVDGDVRAFSQRLRAQSAVPLIRELRDHFSAVAEAEVARVLRKGQGEHAEILTRLASGLVNKLLHDPTLELKRAANAPDGERLSEATRLLFGLGEAAARDDKKMEASQLEEDADANALSPLRELKEGR